MKNIGKPLQIILFCSALLFAGQVQAQLLKKLGKRAERAAERTVERRVDREVSEKTDQTLDSILEPGSKQPTEPQVSTPAPTSGPPADPGVQTGGQPASQASSGGPKSIEVYSKFDFVPGDKLLFYDDFSNDFIGDFPSKWNTNGSGEVVTINQSPQKWLKLLQGYNIHFIPDIPPLPKDYTIEFDLLTSGIDKKTASTAGLTIMLSDDPKFKDGDHYASIFLPIGQYGVFNIWLRNYVVRVGRDINSGIKADIREAVLNQPHISIAVNDQRFRLWVNEQKYVDVPRFIPEGGHITSLKFNLNNLKDGKEDLFISNLKVAEGGVDLRRQLISEGEVSTNGILFDSGSANIQPQSMGIILQISQVLQQEAGMNLKIVGHTDADGSDDSNMQLSKQRAEAVKNALVNVYNVDAGRLSTEGKGESEPVGDNSTPDGKAQNRRVVFKKI